MDAKFRKLIELGAGGFEHADSALLYQLEGTRCLLKEWNATTILQDAALYSVAYSTENYSISKVKVERRDEIRSIISPDVENIVYHYCACDREQFYQQLGQQNVDFYDRFCHENRDISDTLLKQLCELTIASEINKMFKHAEFSEQQKTLTFDLYRKISPFLSIRAQRKAQQIFAPSH